MVYIGLAIFCVISSGWVKVDNDLTEYLPDSTETKRGLTLMDEEFTTFATASVMIDNISYSQAEKISKDIEDIEGVKQVEFDETEDHFKDASALFSVTFDGESDNPLCQTAIMTYM